MEKVQFKNLSGWLKFGAAFSIGLGILYAIILVAIFFSLFLFPVVLALDHDAVDKKRPYHGPVPLGFDSDHFRKTGETIKQNGE